MTIEMASSSNQDDVDETPKKRPRTEGTNDSLQLDSDSPNRPSSSSLESGDSVEQNLPTELSRPKWQEEHIQGLDITISREELPTPQQLLDLFPVNLTEAERQLKPKSFLYDNINIIEKYFLNYSNLHKTLDGEFSTVSRETASQFRDESNYSPKHFYSRQLSSGVDPFVKRWFKRFERCGVLFAEKLFYMTVKRDLGFEPDANGKRKESLKEYDYQYLFDAFVSMFGLQSYGWSEPLTPHMTLQLSKTTISGKADTVYCKDMPFNAVGTVESNFNIITVCEVKKKYSDKKKECCRTTRGSELHSTSSSGNRSPSNIPDSLLGQHGRKLLMYYPYSAKQDAIFGLIVQETKVTFTALKMTAQQYQHILTGRPQFSRPKLMVTKPYDFMKKEDRAYLIRPLLELAMLQEMTQVKRKL